jgi:hypothetical protein
MEKLTDAQIAELADEALNAACRLIQERLGQTDGGVAAQVFCDFSETSVLKQFEAYIRTEIAFLPDDVEAVDLLPCGHPNTQAGATYVSRCETCGAEWA